MENAFQIVFLDYLEYFYFVTLFRTFWSVYYVYLISPGLYCCYSYAQRGKGKYDAENSL